MGLTDGDTKEHALRTVVAVLEATGTTYAVIGGVAMQLYSREPRTTLDVDLRRRPIRRHPAGCPPEGRL